MNERDYTGVKLTAATERDGDTDKPDANKPAGKRASAVKRRFALLNAFIDGALPRTDKAALHRSEIAAWLLLYRHAKPDGTVTASVADLARRTGCCERAMRAALKRLVSGGLLERLKRGTLAGGPSVWRLLKPEATDDDRQRTAG